MSTRELQPTESSQALNERECWDLLRAAPVGRLAVQMAGEPEIFPLNFVVDHGTVVFRTQHGTKLASCVLHPVVAFEVDGYDAQQGAAWSVVVKGAAEQVMGVQALDTIGLPLFPWHAGPKPYLVRIVPTRVTGRLFDVSAQAVSAQAVSGAGAVGSRRTPVE